MELVMRVRLQVRVGLAAAAALLSACIPQIGFDGTSYTCPDGVSCPPGFRCVELVCRGADDDPPVPDAGEVPPDAEPVPVPDAAVPGAPPGPMVDVPAST